MAAGGTKLSRVPVGTNPTVTQIGSNRTLARVVSRPFDYSQSIAVRSITVNKVDYCQAKRCGDFIELLIILRRKREDTMINTAHHCASVCLLILTFVYLLSAVSAENVWAFGDSLSDNGNLALLFATDGLNTTYLPPEAYKPFFPPQLGGSFLLQRLSTGKIFVEYLAEYYGSVLLPSGLESQIGGEAANNFAILGARASLNSQLDLPYQVAQLAARVGAGLDVTNDRAVVAIGSNDVFAAWSQAIQPLTVGGTTVDLEAGKTVVDAAVESLRNYLVGGGGSVQLGDGSVVPVPSLTRLGLSKFSVGNVPNIGLSPWALQQADALGSNKRKALKAARKLSRYFNFRLKCLVREAEGIGLYVHYIDIYKTFRKVHRKAKKLGFVVDEDCFLTNTLATLTDGVPPTPGVFRDTCGPNKTEEFFFIDSAHPTGAFHREIADRILDKLA